MLDDGIVDRRHVQLVKTQAAPAEFEVLVLANADLAPVFRVIVEVQFGQRLVQRCEPSLALRSIGINVEARAVRPLVKAQRPGIEGAASGRSQENAQHCAFQVGNTLGAQQAGRDNGRQQSAGGKYFVGGAGDIGLSDQHETVDDGIGGQQEEQHHHTQGPGVLFQREPGGSCWCGFDIDTAYMFCDVPDDGALRGQCLVLGSLLFLQGIDVGLFLAQRAGAVVARVHPGIDEYPTPLIAGFEEQGCKLPAGKLEHRPDPCPADLEPLQRPVPMQEIERPGQWGSELYSRFCEYETFAIARSDSED